MGAVLVPDIFLFAGLGLAVVGGDELTVRKVLLDWLKDVYQRYGYVAVLVCLVVICAIVFAVILFLPPDVQAMLYRLVGGN